MINQLQIGIVGLGNLAYPLLKAFVKADLKINFLVSNHPENHKELEELTGLKVQPKIPEISQITLILLTLPDKELEAFIEANHFSDNATYCHTSGSCAAQIFENKAKNFGVFYPLQSFVKTKEIEFLKIPIGIEGNNEYSLELISEVAKKISENVYDLNSNQRLALHLSAVIANNFSNYLLGEIHDILEKNQLDKSLLTPILAETIQRFKNHNPTEFQTGPAMRKDWNTIEKHEKFLIEKPMLQQIYKLISQAIISKHHD